ncbi:MAG TPA: GNAT family N-acetyltransferase [Myxococcales bacterium]|nr:GNAT family N-acetyltransferase [Myxococcales bacterium]
MDTGPDFREDHVLRDGTQVTLRHIRPDDAAELRRGLERLSPESRYRRFLSLVGELTDEQVKYLTCVDGRDHVAIVAVTPGVPAEVGLGVARFVRVPDDPEAAEAAITVVDDAQGKGLGRILALALARAAYERGVRRFRGRILADNAAVQQLLADVGATLGTPEGGGVVFDVELTPTPFTPGGRLDVIARRLLRAAANALVGVFGRPVLQR